MGPTAAAAVICYSFMLGNFLMTHETTSAHLSMVLLCEPVYVYFKICVCFYFYIFFSFFFVVVERMNVHLDYIACYGMCALSANPDNVFMLSL